MNWRIWYKGNQKFDGETQSDWDALPDENVIGIAIRFGKDEYDITLAELVSGSDWYWMRNGKIEQSCTSSDVPDEWLPHNAPEGASLKRGRWTTEEELHQIDSEMQDWVK